jgi:hypothetical protein
LPESAKKGVGSVQGHPQGSRWGPGKARAIHWSHPVKRTCVEWQRFVFLEAPKSGSWVSLTQRQNVSLVRPTFTHLVQFYGDATLP